MLEHEMKDTLFWYLDGLYEKIRILEEKEIGKSRADVVAVLPDKLIGFEIKSDSDTYTRLLTQVKDYDKYFDENYLVVGKTHVKAEDHVPSYWGIITIEDDGTAPKTEVRRKAEKNPKLKMRWQMDFLWRREMLNIQQKNGLYKYSGKKRYHVIKYIMDSVDESLLKIQLCDELFERDYTQFDE